MIDGGVATAVFSSGMSAITAVFLKPRPEVAVVIFFARKSGGMVFPLLDMGQGNLPAQR